MHRRRPDPPADVVTAVAPAGDREDTPPVSGAAVDARRRALLLAALGVAAGLSALGGCSGSPRPLATAWPDRLFAHRAAAATLGRDYLAGHPDEHDAAGLLAAVDAAIGRRRAGDWTHLERDRLAAWLAEAIRDEFRAGELVRVAGWWLSVTEARLYALAALA